MSSNGQVIKAAQMFIKHGAGASKGVNLKAEMLYGLTLGIGVGLTFKVWLALPHDKVQHCDPMSSLLYGLCTYANTGLLAT